jgi:hypothetical protein
MLKSLGYGILFSILFSNLLKFVSWLNIVDYDWFNIEFNGMIGNGIILNMLLFTFIGSIVSAYKTIYHMVMFYITIFFKNKSKIHLTVDEEYIIRDSFVELSSGKTIPIKIKKIKWNKDEVKQENK